MNFPCIKCGLCCRRLDISAKVAEEMGFGKFPYKWDKTGRCEMLGKDDLCMVYDNRPPICNIEKVAETCGIDKKEYFNMNIVSCNILLEQDNRKERIDLIT